MTATWTWDSATKGIGKLASSSTSGAVTRAYTFDVYGRPASETMTVDNVAHTAATAYDSAGRPEVLTYPTGFAAKSVYNAAGYLAEVRDNASNVLFWKSVAQSPAGITDEDFGNGTGVVRTFDANTHRVAQIATARDSDGTILQNFVFGYDLAGNMTTRSETTQSLSESFAFDGLDRLATVTGPASKAYTYNELGNILAKSDVGSYTYHASKVHAVASAGGVSYTYDANGNMITSGTKTIAWTSFNMPASVTVGASTHEWIYDSNLARVKYVAPGETTIYVSLGGRLLVEKVTAGGVTEHRHQIYAGGMPVTQFNLRSVGASDTMFLYRDHLGSTTLIADTPGTVSERLSYDAQGKRRFATGLDDIGNSLAGVSTDRGFTNHEHLDLLGLVHMNGRLFDPRIGRFASSDPVWADPRNPQSWNRYSYVLNNPLRYSDPSGYSSEEPDQTNSGIDNPRNWECNRMFIRCPTLDSSSEDGGNQSNDPDPDAVENGPGCMERCFQQNYSWLPLEALYMSPWIAGAGEMTATDLSAYLLSRSLANPNNISGVLWWMGFDAARVTGGTLAVSGSLMVGLGLGSYGYCRARCPGGKILILIPLEFLARAWAKDPWSDPLSATWSKPVRSKGPVSGE